MIFTELVLTNVGPYAGVNRLRLDPVSPNRPVTLIGGLNGAGKTTLLDSLSLVLYGKHGRQSKRGALTYEGFLRQLIHHGTQPEDCAAVELEFCYQEEGQTRIERVRRSWTYHQQRLRETCQVFVNGKLDLVLAENWLEHIQSLIPAKLAELFFFDAEKIERLADPRECQELLRTGIHLLLGVDLVEQLIADLAIVERRQRQHALRGSELEEMQKELHGMERRVAELSSPLEDLTQQMGSATNAVTENERQLEQVEREYQREGGESVEGRSAVERELAELQGNQQAVLAALRDLAADATPLLLLAEQIKTLDKRHILGERARLAQGFLQTLRGRDLQVLEMLSDCLEEEVGVNKRRVVEKLQSLLNADRERQYNYSLPDDGAPLLTQDEHAQVRVLLGGGLARVRARVSEAICRLDELHGNIEQRERTLANTPPTAALVDILELRGRLRAQLNEAHSHLKRLTEERARMEADRARRLSAYEKLLKTVSLSELRFRRQQRIAETSERTRATLEKFRELLVTEHIQKIQSEILECLQRLLRKKQLVAGLTIDPKSFVMQLRDGSGQEIHSDRLSAGERQLLAIAVLWGLLRASGRALPAVIDTPLGRLDGVHRRRLVEQYFPAASHQVLLLSTDEEISGHLLQKLLPSVGRTYTLDYCDERLATTVTQDAVLSQRIDDSTGQEQLSFS